MEYKNSTPNIELILRQLKTKSIIIAATVAGSVVADTEVTAGNLLFGILSELHVLPLDAVSPPHYQVSSILLQN